MERRIRDEQRDDSDLDLYIVMPSDAEIREIDAMILIRRAIRDHKTLPVDNVVGKESLFRQRVATMAFERIADPCSDLTA